MEEYPLTELTTTASSELGKLLENSYRAMNIAFIHEWTLLAERMPRRPLLGPRGGLLEGPRGRFCDSVFDCIRDRVRDHVGRLTTEAAATVLVLEPEELLSELQDGKTMAEVAEEQGMAVDAFTSAMLPEVRQELDALVADGTLTEEQAEAIYDRVEENIDDIVNSVPKPHGPCPRGAFFEGGAPDSSLEPTESSIQA